MLFKKLIPALWWAFLILLLCFLPGSAIPELSFLDWLKPDKLVHLVLFGVLSYLLVRPFIAGPVKNFLAAHPYFSSFILAALYGVFVEVVQEYFIPGRHGDVYDAIADAIGALIGIWIFNSNSRRIPTRK